MLNFITKIKHLPLLISSAKGCGLKKTPHDPRDFQTGLFGWFDYKPKHKQHVIKTLSVKDQKTLNTCQWNATTTQKEVDEKMKLSVRSIVIKGKSMGLIRSNGFSNLRSGQKVLQKWGILEEGLIEEGITSWNKYSDIRAIKGLNKEAAKHKISSYWSVSSRNDVLKLLDKGRIIVTGSKWYSGFNMNGGFSFPWLIYRIIGWLIGGHAYDITGYNIAGYDLNYNNKEVYICQNSFGKLWGQKGTFYVDMDWLDKNNYGYFTNLDMEPDTGKVLRDFDGKNIKGKGSTVYFVQKGKIKAYPDELTYLAFNVRDNQIQNWNFVEDKIIEKIEKGDNMQIEKSLYWDYLKNIKDNEGRLNKLIQLLTKE